MAIWIVVTVGVVTTVLLLVVVAALARHIKALVGTLRRLQEDLRPRLECMQGEQAKMRRHLDESSRGRDAR